MGISAKLTAIASAAVISLSCGVANAATNPHYNKANTQRGNISSRVYTTIPEALNPTLCPAINKLRRYLNDDDPEINILFSRCYIESNNHENIYNDIRNTLKEKGINITIDDNGNIHMVLSDGEIIDLTESQASKLAKIGIPLFILIFFFGYCYIATRDS